MKHADGAFRGARGFTLVELVMAASIMAVLLVAVQSTIMLAAHAVPGANTKATALVTGSAALELLNGDVAYATAASVRTATGLTIQVPDRNGDGAPETIVWGWDGTSGGNLTRSVNGGTAEAVASGVRAFGLTYDTRSAAGSPTMTTSEETLFSSDTGTSGHDDNKVDTNHPVAYYFRPVLPANAVSWSVTRVQLLMLWDGPTDGSYVVQIRTPDGFCNPGTALDTQGGLEANLPSSAAWQTYSFDSARGLSPQGGACVVVGSPGAGKGANVQSHHSNMVASGMRETSGDGGSTWQTAPGVLNHYIYGTYTTPGASPTLYYLTGVRASLRTSPDTGSTVRVTMRVLNEPQVGGP
jgi:prepilin-type N-terminal cleavage/methylation domain-containing protein